MELVRSDSPDANEWRYVDARDMTFVASERRVVLFERGRSFAWP